MIAGVDTDWQDRRVSRRLWSKVTITKAGCWEYPLAGQHRYGRISVGSRSDGTRTMVLAHRVAYSLAYGPIPDGLLVCHHCDNPPCIKPGHLFLGTHQDNMDDMNRKGRGVFLAGEENGRAQLSEEQVQAIRFLRAHGWTNAKLAHVFDVSPTLISAVARRVVWKRTA